jgi:hypothetical protein
VPNSKYTAIEAAIMKTEPFDSQGNITTAIAIMNLFRPLSIDGIQMLAARSKM